ncbi:MAG: hypothetical protein U1F36_22105 [Planctomycetota bacterium]
MFHVYVDPLFGDNFAATWFNPGMQDWSKATSTSPPPTNPFPLDRHPEGPDPLTGLRAIEGRLQHAPYAFRTLRSPLTQSNPPVYGALDYVKAVFGSLPMQRADGITIDHVLVHCLPGLYGPRGGTPIDTRSGIPFNDESFPIRLDMSDVSIQGTSALDTVFDARAAGTAIFEIGTDAAASGDLDGVFIDGITARSARASSGTSVPGAGAAFYFAGAGHHTHVSITNCFIFDNAIGIALDSNSTPTFSVTHNTVIANNTFASNTVGIWSWDTRASNQGTNPRNWNSPAVFNNLFDLADREPGVLLTPVSCWEGLDASAREVVLRGTTPLFDPYFNLRGRDFNAFPDGRTNPSLPPTTFNIGAVNIGTNWPAAPQPGSTFGNELPAHVDLAAWRLFPRLLFVADALQISPSGVGSRHDLRLLPTVSGPNYALGDSISLVNPCIDSGIDGGADRSLSITIQRPLFGPLVIPGYGPGWASAIAGGNANADECPVSAWDFDCEGFGNPRIAKGNLGVPPDEFGLIDIGADERGELIVGGFLEGTRIFAGSTIPGGTSILRDHRRIYFFGNATTSMARPMHNSIVGSDPFAGLFPWYDHVQNRTDADQVTGGGTASSQVSDNLTFGLAFGFNALRVQQALGLQAGLGQVARGPFPRNLLCDFSPHLSLDPHPWWAYYFFLHANLSGTTDGYASNPWYRTSRNFQAQTPDPQTDNPAVFHNRLGTAHNYGPGWWSAPFTFVTSSHLNPPGMFAPTTNFSSWITAPFAQFGPYAPCSGATLTFGVFGFDDAPSGCPDFAPRVAQDHKLGRRYNLEVQPNVGPSPHGNAQTFLVIHETEDIPPAGEGAAPAIEENLSRSEEIGNNQTGGQ